MSFFLEKVPLLQDKTYIIREFEFPNIDYPVHHHPEYEITYISGTSGKRIVGDSIQEFQSEDLVMTGPHLPHQWKSSHVQNLSTPLSKQITLQFHSEFMGAEFINRQEAQVIKQFLDLSKRGIQFYGNTLNITVSYLKRIINAKGFEGLLLFFQLLHTLAKSKHYKLLASQNFSADPKNSIRDNLINPIFQYLNEHYDKELHVNEVAGRFHLSTSAFCHYIKKRTGKNFTRLINELRIAKASRLLVNTDDSVIEIAYQCQYNNISYFNRTFKTLRDMSPTEFRKKYRV